MVKLLIISETRLHRQGLMAILDSNGVIAVVGTAASVSEALEAVPPDSYEVVLFDATAGSGSPEIRKLMSQRAESRIIVLGVSKASADVIGFIDAGVDVCLSRDAALGEAVEAIEQVAVSEKRSQPRIVITRRETMDGVSVHHEPRRWQAELTAREVEILELIDRGHSNKRIAQQLYIEVATVKTHVHNILRKLGVQSRALAAVWLRSRRET